MEFDLSILIPTLTERQPQLLNCVRIINKQIKDEQAFGKIEIIIDSDNREVTTGAKRNRLIEKAKGKYVWFIDDDDEIMEGAIPAILEAITTDCDVIGLHGIMTTNGHTPKHFYHALGNPYCADWSTGKEIYLRYPNHITPMKREIAIQVKFPDQSNFEDKSFADQLKEMDLLKTETKIEIPIYHYKYSTQNKTY